MGGGIAAMASMLIRDSANRRHKQQHKRQKPRPPAAGSSSTSPPSAGAAATTTPPSNSDRISRSDDPGDPRGLTGPRAGDEARGAQAGGAGFGGGLGAGPMVYSFATPCCVSLELARGCEGWVDSIVHGDDAIPRLSTVSLELLKEDMTGACGCLCSCACGGAPFVGSLLLLIVLVSFLWGCLFVRFVRFVRLGEVVSRVRPE